MRHRGQKVWALQWCLSLCVEPQCPPLVSMVNCCSEALSWQPPTPGYLVYYLHTPSHPPIQAVCVWKTERRKCCEETAECLYVDICDVAGRTAVFGCWGGQGICVCVCVRMCACMCVLVLFSQGQSDLSLLFWPWRSSVMTHTWHVTASLMRHTYTHTRTHTECAACNADKVHYSRHTDTALPWTRIRTCWNHTNSQ